jgi:hypothetical protein
MMAFSLFRLGNKTEARGLAVQLLEDFKLTEGELAEAAQELVNAAS